MIDVDVRVALFILCALSTLLVVSELRRRVARAAADAWERDYFREVEAADAWERDYFREVEAKMEARSDCAYANELARAYERRARKLETDLALAQADNHRQAARIAVLDEEATDLRAEVTDVTATPIAPSPIRFPHS